MLLWNTDDDDDLLMLASWAKGPAINYAMLVVLACLNWGQSPPSKQTNKQIHHTHKHPSKNAIARHPAHVRFCCTPASMACPRCKM
mmetsp:Transcript_38213/g.80964  ORF Transcript_38213/g.80964 Transcript_38213/m.80964 type:complete len:86 (+) Transcript_38213:509-766(+)